MTLYLSELTADNSEFPDPSLALTKPNGLLAFGGDLSTERLHNAYRQGIFPWYSYGEPILWWSPSPRAVFIPETFTPSKSLVKFQKKQNYKVTINHATDQLIDLCASTRPDEETWITDEMLHAYQMLAKAGHCHSVEVWQDEQLIGGLYGVSVGSVFCGESMVSIKTNASKIALWYFTQHFVKQGGKLIDCQIMNPHLASLGAIEIPRSEFQGYLLSHRDRPMVSHCFFPQTLSI
ncbi:leucyl/phenylalanyl-tRNA--protein transferase [Vibrio sp. UCD-FRSSP16_10]|uniref:leucyl/phenylalanyl-tRNA--protein transferase n=1 Tax=unclassified Vibrio TaxID=2614977 RepID=UPI0007FE433E|nr:MULTISPECIES: leucyl/phenylalanyl-tRNA--protein transferase [unclassified Vibrio]OBT13922.1 leucyl/phenylalanyl-tRNA--protein transferase [Vibrio sp. UCD-FRSSP16_30]OBT22803.1 leucyl/phenylalanyl-tRNA--protein transferase [Vibrio sp. UCD-FRSSP16_10]